MRKRWAGAQSTCEEGVGGLRGPVCLKSKSTPEAGGCRSRRTGWAAVWEGAAVSGRLGLLRQMTGATEGSRVGGNSM